MVLESESDGKTRKSEGKDKEMQGKTRKNQGNERKPYCPCANDSNDVDDTTVMRLENQKDA